MTHGDAGHATDAMSVRKQVIVHRRDRGRPEANACDGAPWQEPPPEMEQLQCGDCASAG
jgi:hypothetical protein